MLRRSTDHVAHRLVALRRVLLQRLLDHHSQRRRNLFAERIGRLVLHALQHFESQTRPLNG